jgi:uncharacterized protein
MHAARRPPTVYAVLTSIAILVAFGCLSGITTALFGFGGGFVTVPVVLDLGLVGSHADAMHVAVATSTAVMVVNSAAATLAQLRSGRLRREYVWPLAGFIAVGAVIGSLAATRVDDNVVHLLFIAYLGLTILDSVARGGFLARGDAPTPLTLGMLTATAGGTGIGLVASFLGVGGSVLTVPLLRRKGLSMSDAAVLANPLSLPVAVVATTIYALAVPHARGDGRLGDVDLVAAAALLLGSLPTIAVVRRVVGRIPDRLHAVAYLALLTAALAAVLIS